MQCLYCSKETTNPKYCSKRCAAIYNNTKFPKRQRKVFDKDILTDAVSKSTCWAQLLVHLNIDKSSHSYINVQDYVKLYSIDTSHFTLKRISIRKPLEQLGKSRGSIKKRLLETGIKNQCSICSIDSWCERPLSLALDHINGVNTDNRIENLRLICPNCHSQTPTYCGRNKRYKTKTV